MGNSKSSFKKEVFCNTILSQEIRKSQMNNLNLHLKQLEKEETKPKSSRRKEIIKIRAEVNRDKVNNSKYQ